MNRKTLIIAIICIYATVESTNTHLINGRSLSINDTRTEPSTDKPKFYSQRSIVISNRFKMTERENRSTKSNELNEHRIAFHDETYIFVIVLWTYAIILFILICLNIIDPNRFLD